MLDNGDFSNAVSLEVIKKKEKVSAMANVRKGNKQVLLVGSPFLDENNNVVKVITVMRNLTELIRLKEELEETERKKRQYKEELQSLKRDRLENSFLGKDPSILRVSELIDYVAQTDATVLITGETGSGKEVVARELENIIERIVIISSRRVLTGEDIDSIIYMGEKKPGGLEFISIGEISLKEAVQNFEREILTKVLKEYGTTYAAAEVLKTTQPTIVRKAQDLGIKVGKKA